jgi:hypothetical protein
VIEPGAFAVYRLSGQTATGGTMSLRRTSIMAAYFLTLSGASFALVRYLGQQPSSAHSGPEVSANTDAASERRRARGERQLFSAAAPVSLPSASGHIDISGLSDLDRMIALARSPEESQRLLLARRSLDRSLQSWMFRRTRRCSKLIAEDPSELRFVVKLRFRPPDGAEVYSLESLEVSKGAPQSAEAMACVEGRIRESLPRGVSGLGLAGTPFEGNHNLKLQINSGSCTL